MSTVPNESPYDTDEKGRILLEKTASHELYKCTCCNHIGSRYKVTFNSMYSGMALKVFKHCIKTKSHLFDKGDIAGLSHTEYGNFSILQRFGLLYFIKDDGGKKIRGKWGVPMKRLAKFIRGDTTVAAFFWRDSDEDTNELSDERITIDQVPKISRILDKDTLLPVFVECDRLDHSGAFRSPDTVVKTY
jgi:hypothetical protein